MDTTANAIVAALSFVLIFLSGLWLSRSGRPLNVGISTLHKLISLATGIFLLLTIRQRSQVVPLSGVEWIAIGVSGLLFAGTVASGAFQSAERPMPVYVLRLHQVLPVLTALASAALLYLVLGG